MYIKSSFLKTKIRNLCIKVFSKIENNNNCNFYINGEKLLIENLLNNFKKINDKKIIIFDIGANVGTYSNIILEEAKKEI